MPSSKLPSLGFSLLDPEGWEALWDLQCSQMTSPVCHQIFPSGTGQSSSAVEYCSGFQWTVSLETWKQSPETVTAALLAPHPSMEQLSSSTDLPQFSKLLKTTFFGFESTTLKFLTSNTKLLGLVVFSPTHLFLGLFFFSF